MDIIGALTEAATSVFGWLSTSITGVISLFYTEATGLTFMGGLAVIGLCISIFFLLVGVISSFLHLRG